MPLTLWTTLRRDWNRYISLMVRAAMAREEVVFYTLFWDLENECKGIVTITTDYESKLSYRDKLGNMCNPGEVIVTS
jgi:hypothetical protein